MNNMVSIKENKDIIIDEAVHEADYDNWYW